uniref:lanthionine synthetase LanC family protein n=1 Tax=uncultured Dysgonomonas sp. TaxID=206096 RepID=UPI002634FC1E|nr:lanthionine synthetase LanC family protein [uncultured Dysgonomonas sp.]
MTFSKIGEIKNGLLKSSPSIHMGLFGGKVGELLFLLSYYELTDNQEVIEYIYNELDRGISNINFDEIGYSFSHGVSGIGWFIDLMNKKKLISSKSDDVFEEIDSIIFHRSLNDLSLGNYDYLSGGLGAMLYFLKKEIPPKAYIERYIETIDLIKEVECDNFFIYENKKRESCNLGLSHGIPSIIAILIIAYEKKILPELSLNLINGFVNYLLKNIQDLKKKGDTYFLYSTASKNIPTRLAWCYGDLGVGYILYRSSQILKNKEIMNLSIKILSDTANRLDPYLNMVLDAGLCHGSAGIAYILRKLHKMTNLQLFEDRSSYWLKKTIECGTHSDGIAGYLFLRNNSRLPLRGFLEGVSGVGISLISSNYSIDTSWDESLLLV